MKKRITAQERFKGFPKNDFIFYQTLSEYEKLKYRGYLGICKNPKDIYEWLWDRELMPFKEIGEKLGISEKNASLIYRNALRKLRILWKEQK